MGPPTFIHCVEWEQVEELKSFLKNAGAENIESFEATQENWPLCLIKCIPHLSVCWKNEKITETQSIDLLTTISSLVVRLPPNYIEEVVNKICDLYEDFSEPKNRKHHAKLYSLNILFSALSAGHHSRYRIYRALVTCASELGALSRIYTKTEKVSTLLKECQCSPSECQALWRQMSEVHEALGNTNYVTQALINLLSIYPEEITADVRDDAFKCILVAIQDPSFLSHKRLCALKPVQDLIGEPVHKLLEIYVSGGLSDFAAFAKEYPEFFSKNGLDEKACLDKLRTLSLMELAENVAELDYDTVCNRIDLPEEQLEGFIIEAVRQRVITCKLDQIHKRILITGALPRNFGRLQWQVLHNTLKEWHSGLRVVQSSLATMIGNSAQ